jgi:hypothetical protein
MGRSYWFECSRCGYRAKVAGGTDRGHDCFVQTILCRDCKELYDVVVRWRTPVDVPEAAAGQSGSRPIKPSNNNSSQFQAPPVFPAALNRLPLANVHRSRWVEFRPQCPVSRLHRIENWTERDKCPRCRLPLERNVLPYRVWE